MATLTDIRAFGAISAEDDNLRKYFVRTPVYEQLLNGEKQVVIGRKGAGKTALYLAIIDKASAEGAYAIGLAFRDYPWALHYQYAVDTGDKYERFVASWRFLIFLEMFKIILTDTNRPTRYTQKEQKEALSEVEKFISKNWGIIAFDYKKTFPSGGFKLDNINVGPQAFGFGLGGVDVRRQGGQLGETIVRLNEWMWNCLKVLAPNAPKIFVLFDELDSGFNPNEPNYIDRVTGLLVAIRAASRDFRNSRMPFHPIAFLRSDIFDALHFGDKNKLTEANAAFLVWNESLDYNGCSLKELIDYRIREELGVPDGEDAWAAAFDDQEMRKTQHKFHYMTFRSYLRPRDVIKFCNCALEQAQLRLKGARPEDRILNADLRAARKSFSGYLLSELDDEIAQSHKDWHKYLEILRRVGANKFDRKKFDDAYTELKEGLGFDLGEDEVLHLFYTYSIIGFEKIKRTGSGYYHHFRYMDETIRFDASARTFLVHRGLKETLELTEARPGEEED